MRYVRLEVMSPDLQGERDKEWEELCRYWSQGLRGLRLKILRVISTPKSTPGADKLLGRAAPNVEIRDAEGHIMPWIKNGMNFMKSLEHLEIELVIPNWDHRKKLDWCNSLEKALNEARAERMQTPIRVICTEKVG